MAKSGRNVIFRSRSLAYNIQVCNKAFSQNVSNRLPPTINFQNLDLKSADTISSPTGLKSRHIGRLSHSYEAPLLNSVPL